MTWPINSGKDFKGVYNLYDKNLVLFTANTKAADEDTVRIDNLSNSLLDERLGEKDAATLREDVELVDGVHGQLKVTDYLEGQVAPVFFGSAINNFGVRENAGYLYPDRTRSAGATNLHPTAGCRRRQVQRIHF